MIRIAFEHLLIILGGFAANIPYTTVTPVLPLEIKHRKLSSIYSGLIFWSVFLNLSSFSVGFCCALFISKPLIQAFGRLKSAVLMYSLMAINLVLFGVVKTTSSDPLFIGVSLLSRLCEGMASCFVHSTLITMVSAYFVESASYINAEIFGVLLAEFVGPLWGGLLFDSLGYTGLFFLQGVTILVFSLTLCYFRDHERQNPPQ